MNLGVTRLSRWAYGVHLNSAHNSSVGKPFESFGWRVLFDDMRLILNVVYPAGCIEYGGTMPPVNYTSKDFKGDTEMKRSDNNV